jgi:hypothetical protein
LLGLIAEVLLNPDDKRPEPGYEFHPPSADESRGPCLGLNLLANYGYLPRNGMVNLGQVVEATVLSVFAVLTDNDIATESWNLGAGVGAQRKIVGLNRHSTLGKTVLSFNSSCL